MHTNAPAMLGVLPDRGFVHCQVDAKGLAVGDVAVLPLQGGEERGEAPHNCSPPSAPRLYAGRRRAVAATATGRWRQPPASLSGPQLVRRARSGSPACNARPHLHAAVPRLAQRGAAGGGDAAELLGVLLGDVGDVAHDDEALEGCSSRQIDVCASPLGSETRRSRCMQSS